MAQTFVNLQSDCQGALGDTTSDTLTRIKRALNRSGSDFWYRHPWFWRNDTKFVETTAPYSTGTVVVTNGSATVTGTGTTFATFTTLTKKFALTIGGPWYRATRDSNTQLTLDRNYVGDTASAQAYVLYQDEFILASTAESVLESEVFLCTASGQVTSRLTRHDAPQNPTSTGTPTWWCLMDHSSGNIRLRVGPSAPDSVFSIRYGFMKRWTDMSADGDECVIPERWRHIIFYGAMRELYLLYSNPGLAAGADQMFERKMFESWSREQAASPQTFQIQAFDAAVSPVWHRMNFPVTHP